jgi:hypothetical protein
MDSQRQVVATYNNNNKIWRILGRSIIAILVYSTLTNGTCGVVQEVREGRAVSLNGTGAVGGPTAVATAAVSGG